MAKKKEKKENLSFSEIGRSRPIKPTKDTDKPDPIINASFSRVVNRRLVKFYDPCSDFLETLPDARIDDPAFAGKKAKQLEMQRIGNYDRNDPLTKLLLDIVRGNPEYLKKPFKKNDEKIFQGLSMHGRVIDEYDKEDKSFFIRGKDGIVNFKALQARLRRIRDKLSQEK